MSAGFAITEHTADVGVRAWGDSEAAVFEQVARAMFSLICDPGTVDRREVLDVAVEAPDHELLLVAWLNELLFLFESRRLLLSEFEVLELGATTLRARASGEALDERRHALCGGVKAATYHHLWLGQRDGRWEAQVILDV
jgi:SHS2 domain-containing protein